MNTEIRPGWQTTHALAGEAPEHLDEAIQETIKRRQSITRRTAAFLGVHPEKVCELLRNVWRTSKGQPPLTDREMFAGMSLISRYELDPIAREVYVTRNEKGQLLTIIGIDGWIKILDRTEGYDGFDQELGPPAADEQLTWVETKIYSTRRSHPAVYRAFSHEYAALGGFMAQKIPSHMLRLFSLRHAARLFTPIGGQVVTEEEARWMSLYDVEKATEPQAEPEAGVPSGSPMGAADLKERLKTRRQKKQPEPAPRAETVQPAETELVDFPQRDDQEIAQRMISNGPDDDYVPY
jgi:hypothetical protein